MHRPDETAASVPALPYASIAEPPTRVRYGVLAFMCSMALLLYVDRVCIGQAAGSIRAELGLSKTQMGWVFTVFSLAYALFEVPAGHWGDRHGSRGVIARVVVFWSIFTALTGAAVNLWTLLVIRFLFGAGEAGAFPNAARVITRWFPPDGRGRARGTIGFCSLVGAAVAPILSAYLIRYVGWRITFVIFGAVGIAWVAVFYAWFRDDPAEHPRTNAAERVLIGESEAAPPADAESHAAAGIPWSRAFASLNVWLLGLVMTVSGMLFYILFQWFPSYLKEGRGVGEVQSGWLTATVMAGGAAGCLFGGWLSDAVLRRSTNLARARKLSGASMLLLAGLSALSVRLFDQSTAAVTLCNAAALFFMQANVPTWWSVVAEISGRHGGAMWGLMNSMASLALMSLTVTIGYVVDLRQQAGFSAVAAWSPMFDAIAVALLFGAGAWMFVNASRSIVREPA